MSINGEGRSKNQDRIAIQPEQTITVKSSTALGLNIELTFPPHSSKHTRPIVWLTKECLGCPLYINSKQMAKIMEAVKNQPGYRISTQLALSQRGGCLYAGETLNTTEPRILLNRNDGRLLDCYFSEPRRQERVAAKGLAVVVG